MSAKLLYAGLSEIGAGHENNNDHWCANSGLGLFAVADGMGNSVAAGVASKLVTNILPSLLQYRLAKCADLRAPEATAGLLGALIDLSRRVYSESQGRPSLVGMGTTVVLVLVSVSGQCALVGHLGDSRAYHFQGDQLRCLTKDHTLVQYMLDEQLIAEREAKSHPSRGQLTQYIGMEGTPCPAVSRVQLQNGDRLLLCSDGLIKPLSEPQIAQNLRQSPVPDVVCRRLVNAAKKSGGTDDITVVVVG